MAKKKDGITDLTKMLVMLAERLTPYQFQKVRDVCFALLNGVNYGYSEFGPKFLQDSNDIFAMHSNAMDWRVAGKQKYKKRKGYVGPVPTALKNKNINVDNVINLASYLGKDK